MTNDTGKLTNLAWLMAHIERVLPEGGAWCTISKAQQLAAMVIAHRPHLIVELGVWQGGSFVPMMLAANEVAEATKRSMRMVAIDAWSPAASIAGQVERNAAWWGGVDHDKAYDVFQRRIRETAERGLVTIEVARTPSDAYDVDRLDRIGLLHVDGNHGEQVMRDVRRFCPRVRMGGLVVLDDVGWEGGHVSQAVDWCRANGLEDLYEIDTGLVLQRIDRV